MAPSPRFTENPQHTPQPFRSGDPARGLLHPRQRQSARPLHVPANLSPRQLRTRPQRCHVLVRGNGSVAAGRNPSRPIHSHVTRPPKVAPDYCRNHRNLPRSRMPRRPNHPSRLERGTTSRTHSHRRLLARPRNHQGIGPWRSPCELYPLLPRDDPISPRGFCRSPPRGNARRSVWRKTNTLESSPSLRQKTEIVGAH